MLSPKAVLKQAEQEHSIFQASSAQRVACNFAELAFVNKDRTMERFNAREKCWLRKVENMNN